MSGIKRIRYLITGNLVDTEDATAVSYWINRLVTPILRALLSAVNKLVGDAITVTEDTTLSGTEGLVLVDASAGPVSVVLSKPTELFHLLIVQKVDATANAVTVAAPGTFTLNGAAGLPLAAQYDRLLIVADDSAFYA
jgi:hypothetical protein